MNRSLRDRCRRFIEAAQVKKACLYSVTGKYVCSLGWDAATATILPFVSRKQITYFKATVAPTASN